MAIIASGAIMLFALFLLGCPASPDSISCDVHVGGFSISSSDLNMAGFWKNGKWSPLPPIDPAVHSRIYASAFFDGSVYDGGFCGDDSHVMRAGYWKDTTWHMLTPIEATGDSLVMSITEAAGDIYCTGYSCDASGIQIPGYWRNGSWHALVPGSGYIHGYGMSIAVVDW